MAKRPLSLRLRGITGAAVAALAERGPLAGCDALKPPPARRTRSATASTEPGVARGAGGLRTYTMTRREDDK